MGVLRFYLAAAVFAMHHSIGAFPWLPFSFEAVLCFYIVSGFYMSLVLTEKYNGRLAIFFVNRAFRLYPIYWAVLSLWWIANMVGLTQRLPFGSPAQLANQGFLFPSVIWTTVTLHPGNRDLFLGQSYTIGMEMLFYCAAPLLVRLSSRSLLVVWVAAFLLLQLPTLLSLPERPWQYEFAPTVFFFFVTGVFSHRMFERLKSSPVLPLMALPAFFSIPLAAYVIDDVHIQEWVRRPAVYALYAAVALALPSLFAATKSSRVDRFVGDLSYPIYLCQGFAVMLVCGVNEPVSLLEKIVAIATTLAISVLLVLCVDRQVERLRQRIARSSHIKSSDLLDTAPAVP